MIEIMFTMMVIMLWHQNYFVNDCWSVKKPNKFPHPADAEIQPQLNHKTFLTQQQCNSTHNYIFQISMDPICPMKWIKKPSNNCHIAWLKTIKYCNTEFCMYTFLVVSHVTVWHLKMYIEKPVLLYQGRDLSRTS